MDDVYTTKELAEKAGVPWQTIAAWKRYEKIPPKAVTADGHFLKSVVDPLLENGELPDSASPAKPQKNVARAAKKEVAEQSFEEFARTYWQEGTRAVDMLFSPQEVRSRILEAVRETLRYAYERLNGVETSESVDEVEPPALLSFVPMDYSSPSGLPERFFPGHLLELDFLLKLFLKQLNHGNKHSQRTLALHFMVHQVVR